MKYQDLDLRELLEPHPDEGWLQFGGGRALLFQAVSLGLLRKELVATLGLAGARCILTRFGFAHGWQTAEALRTAFPWDSERDWRLAGGRLATLQGHVRVEPVHRDYTATPDAPFAESRWFGSYEAEQHLLHLGRADEAVCWALCGSASGYMSRVTGERIYCVETRCRGRGDPHCYLVGDPVERWGEEHAEDLAFFNQDSLPETLGEVTAAAARAERRLRRRRRVGAGAAPEEAGPAIRSPRMREVLGLARRVAAVDTTVLITGESGTGKERMARWIHDSSPRASGPFLAVNCGAIPETLIESELFGHVRGAFTGAQSDRIGLFEEARGGTLLLDEVGELPELTQVKLLRVLQEREVRPVGSSRGRALDVRVLAATNRDLTAEVAAGRFREDLLYRLRVFELPLPPLRERREDLLGLARELLLDAAQRLGRDVRGLTPEAADRLAAHPWPGNVRELANAMEHAVVLAAGTRITPRDLPAEVRVLAPPRAVSGEVRPLAEIEKAYILGALEANDGHRARTAEQLGIGVATLYRRLQEYQGEDAPSRKTGRSK